MGVIVREGDTWKTVGIPPSRGLHAGARSRNRLARGDRRKDEVNRPQYVVLNVSKVSATVGNRISSASFTSSVMSSGGLSRHSGGGRTLSIVLSLPETRHL